MYIVSLLCFVYPGGGVQSTGYFAGPNGGYVPNGIAMIYYNAAMIGIDYIPKYL